MIEYPKSEFELKLEQELLRKTTDKSKQAVEFLMANKPLEQLMGFCNVVSVERLGYNDHGRVHAKIVTLNSLKIMNLLQQAEIQPNIVKEKIGDLDDARLVITVAGFLHDLGMSITREGHEENSVRIGDPFIDKPFDAVGDIVLHGVSPFPF